MSSFLAYLRTILLAAAGASSVLVAANIPAGYWDKHKTLFLAIIILGVAAAIAEPVMNWLGLRHATKAAIERSDSVRSALAGLLIELAKLANADWTSTGIFAMQARGHRIPILRCLHYDTHIRLARSDFLPPRIRYDHGPAGTTLAKGDAYFLPWEETVEYLKAKLETDVHTKEVLTQGRLMKYLNQFRWRKSMITRKCWRKIDREQRWRLSYSEFKSMGNYKTYVTYPIRLNSGKVIGVISVDVRSEDENSPVSTNMLDTNDVIGQLNSAARGVTLAWSSK